MVNEHIFMWSNNVHEKEHPCHDCVNTFLFEDKESLLA